MVKIAEVSKEIQYEVFKRDHFTCQDCGKKVPAAVLYVGYDIDPADGGTDDIGNLKTKCYDCSDLRAPEMLAERRRQFEMLVQWKKSQKNYRDDLTDLVVSYVNAKIMPDYSLNPTGVKNLRAALKMSSAELLLDTIDEVFEKSARYDEDGKLTKESGEAFVNNIGRFLYVKSLPPVEQQLYLMRGAYKKKLGYFNKDKALRLLKDYVQALREAGWSEGRILQDLKESLTPNLDKCTRWTTWHRFIEGWTSDIRKWDKPAEEDQVERRSLDHDMIYSFTRMDMTFAKSNIEIIHHLYKGFPEYTEENGWLLEKELYTSIQKYLYGLRDRLLQSRDIPTYSEKEIHDVSNSIKYDKYYKLDNLEQPADLSFAARVTLSEGSFISFHEAALEMFTYHNNRIDYPSMVNSTISAIGLIETRLAELEELLAPLPF